MKEGGIKERVNNEAKVLIFLTRLQPMKGTGLIRHNSRNGTEGAVDLLRLGPHSFSQRNSTGRPTDLLSCVMCRHNTSKTRRARPFEASDEELKPHVARLPCASGT